ncbi:baseplate J/gp47 family protein [Desulfoluna butyratoxydans]|uniref:Baseplate protein j-like n=1 Tax=Desulfoluna butyratoxydans TaxID=231438 RepID=A0A4U8YGC7_9BACT|nr:baseplate J/gp47 family protein [Desulfoluna butyratoxydans]VFQ42385.1 baseplate protein j-like [Desulfoluna butyratoxydans]
MTDVYEQMLVDAGIPVSQEAMETEWRAINAEEEVGIANDSEWAPFWRLITAIATKPAMWLVQLLATQVLPNFFLKDATGAWLELLAWAVDLERKKAATTRGFLVFTREAADGEVTVEAGILVATPPINTKIYRVRTTEEVTIPDGVISAQVPVEAEIPGTAHNLGPGYFTVLPEPVSGIAAVTNEAEWITIAGADAESDDSLRLRCRNQFSAVGQYHHDAAYRADISLFAGIQPDFVWFEHDAPRGPGSANAFVMIDSGQPSQSFVDGINTYIRDQGHHGHGDDMLCFPMPEKPAALVVTVYHDGVLSGERIAALKQAVSDRVRFAFRENQDFSKITRTMPFSRFSFSTLAYELHQQLPDLKSVSFSLGDIVSAMEIPTLSSLTVNTEVV